MIGREQWKHVLTGAVLLAHCGLSAAAAPPTSARESGVPALEAWRQKVDPWVLRTAAGDETEFLVVLREQADLSPAARLPGKEEKGRFVFERLTAIARSTQGPLLEELDRLGAEFRPFWIVNMIWVRGGEEIVEAMAKRPEVARLDGNRRVAFDGPVDRRRASKASAGVEWNIAQVDADDVWALGYTGQEVVIGGQDTGYDWEHPALKEQYRGWDGDSASHDYNWHDAIHTGGGVCGPDSPEPCDDGSHGTHTMGTMLGDDGGANQVGMAPGARWIGCRNMNQGAGTPATYTECFQWFVAPTDLDDQNPDPAKVAEVYAETCTCYEQNHETVRLLAEDSEHIEGAPVAVTFVKLEQNDSVTGAVELTVKQIMQTPWTRVDAGGTTLQELPVDPEPSCTALTLYADGPDDSYRIHSQTSLTGCPPGS